MAEAVVQTVISKAAEMAADQLVQMGSSLYHLQDNIRLLERQMRTLQSYLKDAESKKAKNHQVANLIVNIRDLAQDAEDILDTYLPEFERHKTKGPFHFVKHASCILCYGATANSFALKIKKIEERAVEAKESMDSCGIAQDANTGANDDTDIWKSRKLFLRTRDSKVFGREETLQILEEKMLSKDKQCRIISVVGQGGIGKTTVAKKIYLKAKNQFQSCAMVYVSQKPKVEELLLDISKQVGLSEDKIKENLEDNLRLFLQERRYLIFLDDIWEQEPWDPLRNVLVTNSENGSRILVTSRNIDVCRYIGNGNQSSLVSLKLLSKDEGNELFNNLMFPTSQEAPLPQVFKDIGEEIVEKCSGLPLAIEVAVGLLRAKERHIGAWKQVLESMKEGTENRCQKMLALSYDDLPTELKPLFLYFGIFPEDHEIFVSELIRLWVPEKLVQVDGSRKPKNIVEGNLEKLISRNLIQVSKRRSDGRIKSCRIHDLLHNLCVQVAEGSNFFCTWNNLPSSDFASIVRRVTSNSYNSYSSSENNVSVPEKLRSLFCFSEYKELFKFIKTSALDLKFLRFLIIQVSDHEKVHLPNEIGKLRSLICIRLWGNFVIPSSISRLKRLLTLEIVGKAQFSSISVPASILQMKQLRHLILNNVQIAESSKSRRNPREEVEVALPSLETLYVEHESRFFCNSLKKLSNLKNLSMRFRGMKMMEVLSDGASVIQKLEILKLRSKMSPSCWPCLDLSGYQNLVKLHLSNEGDEYCFGVGGGWIEFPPNLVSITLVYMDCMDGRVMEVLKRLSKLAIIKLKYCQGDNLNFCGENSFLQLQVLKLIGVCFDELIVDEIGMPNLYKVIYEPDYRYPQIIPERLQKLVEFKEG